MFPAKLIASLSLGGAYLLSMRSEKSVTGFLVNFLLAFLCQSFAWALWDIVLYPNFFSSLIGLPEPGGSSWWNGQYKAIAALPSGVPQIGW